MYLAVENDLIIDFLSCWDSGEDDLDTRNDKGNYSLDENGNYVPFHDDKYWFGFMPVLGISWEF